MHVNRGEVVDEASGDVLVFGNTTAAAQETPEFGTSRVVSGDVQLGSNVIDVVGVLCRCSEEERSVGDCDIKDPLNCCWVTDEEVEEGSGNCGSVKPCCLCRKYVNRVS